VAHRDLLAAPRDMAADQLAAIPILGRQLVAGAKVRIEGLSERGETKFKAAAAAISAILDFLTIISLLCDDCASLPKRAASAACVR
jgi:hypothetical protein